MPLDFSAFLRDADVLVIVPPFAGLDRPSLGAHVLQSCAKQAGYSVSILYANLVLSEEMGELKYEAICYAPTSGLIGERFFAAAAYDVPPLGRNACMTEKNFDGDMPEQQIDLAEFQRLEARARAWIDEVVEAVLRLDFKIIGCTTTFEQTAASVALLKRIKQLRPDIITIIAVTPLSDEQFLLLDTRNIEGSERLQFLNREEASLILVARRADSDVDVEWALERKLLVELDSFYVPLATAKAEILREFESEIRGGRDMRVLPSLPVVQQYA
jgi:hypothetical protein